MIIVETARSDHQWTGVAVSAEGRIFVNFPRWAPSIPLSVGELQETGEVIAYPDPLWNSWGPEDPPGERFVCVQSVYVDDLDRLWVLDPASPYLRGTVPGGPKLIRIDLETDTVVEVIPFDSTVAGHQSYLNDVRIDTWSKTAYITDSGSGAIVVVDLSSGTSRRLLADHRSTKAEEITLTIAGNLLPIVVHSDGIALDVAGGWLYYQALTGRTLYRVPTAMLGDERVSSDALASSVEQVAVAGPSDGLLFDDGHIYLSSIEENAVKRVRPGGTAESVAADDLLEWPDSFARGPGGAIYVTTSRIGFPPGTQPYRLFRLEPAR